MRSYASTAVALIVTAAALAQAQAPASGTPAGTPGAALTALDYLEIEQLVYRYAYALDSGAENGYAYAGLYAEDGTFTGTNQGPGGRTYKGRDALAALARGGRRGPDFVSHYVTNVIVEPAPGGAVGRTYVAILDIGDGGNGAMSRVDHGGLYNDTYVRTPDGWRFGSRTFYASTSGAPVQPPPSVPGPARPLVASPSPATSSAGDPPAGLTAEDYLAIQQLVFHYPYALDQNTDDGASYARLFTRDAVFTRPRTTGHENLAKLATAQPHGPDYTRHFLANPVIQLDDDGRVTGKQYLVVVDIAPPGRAGAIFLGGHYEDVYERTPEGWRFASRAFIPSATGGAAADAAAPRR